MQESIVLGPDPSLGQRYFHHIPGGRWFVRRLEPASVAPGVDPEGAFALIGCSVVPGYDDRDIQTKTLTEIKREKKKK